MSAVPFSERRIAVLGPLAGGCAALLGAALLLPSDLEIAAAVRRAGVASIAELSAATNIARIRVPGLARAEQEPLAQRFAAGKPMTGSELAQLLAQSVPSADAATLVAIAGRIGPGDEGVTAKVGWDLLAAGRAAVARDFIEQRPDRSAAATWRLRLEIHRRAGDVGFARQLLRAAAERPGSAEPKDIVEAAYALGTPELVLVAAERGAVPRLTRALSLDLAQRAVRSGRIDLVGRVDRAGTPEWRHDDPWLAMRVAQRAGDTAAALRYAALLPSGGEAARRAIILSSGDRAAIRNLLLAEGGADASRRPAVAEQLIGTGFRDDGVALLRAQCAQLKPGEPACRRLLYLMGPRPDSGSLAWLRQQAAQDPDWLGDYVERERPAAALAYLEAGARPESDDLLVLRLKLAARARDRAAAERALSALLDGRELSAGQVAAISAAAPARLSSRFVLALARARVAAGTGLPSDRLDLAWDAWNRKDVKEAAVQLRARLDERPDDRAALRLMAEVEAERGGKKAARPWLERLLATSPPRSKERAEILDKLGRRQAAMALVEELRAEAPQDKSLVLLHARLVLAKGDPGRVRKMVRP